LFIFLRLDSTLGCVPSSRDNIISLRTNTNNCVLPTRTNRSSSQSRTGQITVLEHLQIFNERLVLVEQQMSSMTSILQRIDDRMNQSNMT
jgi:hypothetical protein